MHTYRTSLFPSLISQNNRRRFNLYRFGVLLLNLFKKFNKYSYVDVAWDDPDKCENTSYKTVLNGQPHIYSTTEMFQRIENIAAGRF